MIQMAQTKIIKCNYCGHKGQSLVEESTSVISYLIIAMIVMATWDWQIASSWLYPLSFILCIFPIIAGFFRIQSHSCSKCLNEVKQSSIFNYLDMDDDIMSVRLSSFGFVIKRRSLLYSILVCLIGLLTYHVAYKEIVVADHGHLFSLVGIEYKPVDHEL